MIPVYLNELIDVLIAKTNSNSCYWNRTSSQGQYKLMLKGGMVVLSYREGLLGKDSLKFDIYDETGKIVDTFIVNDNDKTDYNHILHLYNSTKNQKDQITRNKICNFIEEINTSTHVGIEDTVSLQ